MPSIGKLRYEEVAPAGAASSQRPRGTPGPDPCISAECPHVGAAADRWRSRDGGSSRRSCAASTAIPRDPASPSTTMPEMCSISWTRCTPGRGHRRPVARRLRCAGDVSLRPAVFPRNGPGRYACRGRFAGDPGRTAEDRWRWCTRRDLKRVADEMIPKLLGNTTRATGPEARESRAPADSRATPPPRIAGGVTALLHQTGLHTAAGVDPLPDADPGR